MEGGRGYARYQSLSLKQWYLSVGKALIISWIEGWLDLWFGLTYLVWFGLFGTPFEKGQTVVLVH